MKIKWVRCHPVFIFRSDWFVKPRGGCAWTFLCLCLVFVRSDLWGDDGLIRHELVHVDQHVRSFYLHPLFYWLNDNYRLNCEVEAYRVQLGCYPSFNSVELICRFAYYISDWYGLDISYDMAMVFLAGD